jgi:hypothetical protein
MMLTDRFMSQVFSLGPVLLYTLEAIAAVSVLIVGKVLVSREARVLVMK